jgi:hypothetical protein
VTVAKLLHGEKVDMPPRREVDAPSKKAPNAKGKLGCRPLSVKAIVTIKAIKVVKAMGDGAIRRCCAMRLRARRALFLQTYRYRPRAEPLDAITNPREEL